MNVKIISAIILVFYLLTFSYIVDIVTTEYTYQINKSAKYADEVSVSDSVSFMITRNRWYGTIYDNTYESNLYLFDFLKIPLRINGTDVKIFHLIFFLGLLGFNVWYHRKVNKTNKSIVYE